MEQTNIMKKPGQTFSDPNQVSKEQAIAYLSAYLQQYNCFRPKDIQGLDEYFDMRTVRKNDYFFRQNDQVNYIGFIVHGAIKQFRSTHGTNYITYLLTESQMSMSNTSWFSRQNSDQNALCVEDTLLLIINHDGLRRIVRERPVFLKFFADLSAENYNFYEKRLASFQMMDAQERYEDLQINHPHTLQRFCLQDIANYIGIKPETLSRIRSISLKKAI